MSVYTRDHKHDALHLIAKRIEEYQSEGRQWLANAWARALVRLLEKDDGESAATAINYCLGFEKYCAAYLGIPMTDFRHPRDDSNGAKE